VRFRLGDPRVVPCFHCTFLLHMPPSMTAGSSSAALAQFLDRGLWPSPRVHGLGTPKIPIIRFRWGDGFAASLVRCSLRPVELLAPLTDLTGHFAQPTGTFTPELSASRSPFSSSGITTVATERFHRWDFHPLERQLASLHGLFHPLVGSRTGAILRRCSLAVAPRFLWECLTS